MLLTFSSHSDTDFVCVSYPTVPLKKPLFNHLHCYHFNKARDIFSSQSDGFQCVNSLLQNSSFEFLASTSPDFSIIFVLYFLTFSTLFILYLLTLSVPSRFPDYETVFNLKLTYRNSNYLTYCNLNLKKLWSLPPTHRKLKVNIS